MLVPARAGYPQAKADATRHGSGNSVISACGHQSEVMRQRRLPAPRARPAGWEFSSNGQRKRGSLTTARSSAGPHEGSGSDAVHCPARSRTLDGPRSPARSGIPRSPVSAVRKASLASSPSPAGLRRRDQGRPAGQRDGRATYQAGTPSRRQGHSGDRQPADISSPYRDVVRHRRFVPPLPVEHSIGSGLAAQRSRKQPTFCDDRPYHHRHRQRVRS